MNFSRDKKWTLFINKLNLIFNTNKPYALQKSKHINKKITYELWRICKLNFKTCKNCSSKVFIFLLNFMRRFPEPFFWKTMNFRSSKKDCVEGQYYRSSEHQDYSRTRFEHQGVHTHKHQRARWSPICRARGPYVSVPWVPLGNTLLTTTTSPDHKRCASLV